VRCKIDENLPIDAAALLREAGHDCHTVYDEALAGAPDQRVIDTCRAEGRALLTLDLDFADLRTYPPADHPGIIVLRPAEPDKEHVLRLLARTLPVLEREAVVHSLWIVEETRVRIRRSDVPAV
jgi:predicted nuclease of predicted toxin-antitoxin system